MGAVLRRGLVETSEDFGTQGAAPSHPELLDWLAVTFVRDGWRMKALHRRIVMSAAYRQSSAASPALTERDPNNRLIARGPRFRVDAEMVRDIALAASGLLGRTIGGPACSRRQPGGIWQNPIRRPVGRQRGRTGAAQALHVLRRTSPCRRS
jgi:hypothetical protein